MPRQLGHASEQDEEATDEMSLVAVPDKAKRARRQRIKCVCPTVSGDKLVHCRYFPPPVCHCGDPFLDWARIVASPRTEEHKINTDKQD